jgi:anaerobic selenocysteine-containing dehydrogenase
VPDQEPNIALSEPSGDQIKTTTCYMCACRCGIRVHLKDGRVRYIDGNRDHPVNRGVICGKGAAGIMTHTSPSRLRAPLKRVGPRGSGEFQEISWDEALDTATDWLKQVRRRDPGRLAFFTGRDQSQALTGWFAQQYGTHNFAAHGGFCSVNMAAAGIYTFGGSFWEFGEPDWEHTQYFMLFGVAEDHASNPIKIALGKLKEKGVKIVAVNPIRTGYGAIADEWVGIRPGTDGLFVGALIHELLREQKVDLEYLARFTNAHWLVIQNPGGADDGLFARDENGKPLAFDKATVGPADATSPDIAPALVGSFTLPDGRKVRPSFALIAERFLSDEYDPERVAETTAVPVETIRRIARELAHAAFEQQITLDVPWTDTAGRRHAKTVGRPVSMHAMRGISAHANGFQTCRMLHLLQIILGSIDCPGGFRYMAPFPRPTPPGNRPGRPVSPGFILKGAPLGFPQGPEDLLVEPDGKAQRIDKAYSWDAPLAAHGLMHMVITNAAQSDPYPVDVLLMYMANMSWNSSMNIPAVLKHLTAKDEKTGDYKIPRIIYSDAYSSEMIAYSDLILPDTTYLERWDCISLLDRPISSPEGPADAIRQPVVKPDRDVRPFQDVLIDLGARLKLPGLVNEKGEPKYPSLFPDYMVNHERSPKVGMLAGWRGDNGGEEAIGSVNPRQLERYIENQCFWQSEIPHEAHYFKPWNKAYLDWAVSMGFLNKPEPIFIQLYSETIQKFRLVARGHGDVPIPDQHRERVATYFDPLPIWYMPFEEASAGGDFDFHAVTQRPMAMYHSWGSQNAWLRQIHGENMLHIHRETAAELGIKEGDWVKLTSPHSTITVRAKPMDGVNKNTVWTWNAIGKRSGAWNLAPDANESKRGFLLNHLIRDLLPPKDGYRYANADPVTGQAAWYDLRVRIEKAVGKHEHSEPHFPTIATPNLPERPDILRYGQKFRPEVKQ